MRSGQQLYLDLGCAFAQDVRRLVADGVDSKKCYGADLRLDFLELGYELFRDKGTLETEFIAADIFDPDSALRKFDGRLDIIGASSFFHLFDWNQQKAVAIRVVRLLKPEANSLLLGRQVGNVNPGELMSRVGQVRRFRHDATTQSQRTIPSQLMSKIATPSKTRSPEIMTKTRVSFESSILERWTVTRKSFVRETEGPDRDATLTCSFADAVAPTCNKRHTFDCSCSVLHSLYTGRTVVSSSRVVRGLRSWHWELRQPRE